MKRLIRTAGFAAYWLGWPFFWVYFRLSKRTRVLLTCGDKVLIVSGWIGDGRWGLPGGGLNRREDPAEGALRELREEVGVVLSKSALTFLGTALYNRHGYRYVYFQFAAEVPEVLPVRVQHHEIADAQWADWRMLTAQNTAPNVLAALREWRTAKTGSFSPPVRQQGADLVQ